MKSRFFQRLSIVLSLTLFCGLSPHGAPGAQTLPAGFTNTLVANVSAPTALAFTPDGRMLITSQGGALRVFKNGALLATPAITFNTSSSGAEPKICTGGEQGLLGVAVDPQFASNNFIYLFYTARNGSGCGMPNYSAPNYNATNQKVNRVSRFVLGANDLVAPTSEFTLVDRMPALGTNHNAGDVHFGKDGFLYISIGDGGTDWDGSGGSAGGNNAARDRHVLTGKILRITRDGGIPPDNPFTGAGTGRCNETGATTIGNHCQETFAWGLRNPFRFAMDPNTIGTRFFINDVGQGAREEIDLGQSGADYGWNCREGTVGNSTTGPCDPPPPDMVEPWFDYGRTSGSGGLAVGGCASITGGAVIPNGIWPTAYDGRYLFADYVCGGIFSIRATGTPPGAGSTGNQAANFVTGLGNSSATSLRFGPDGNDTVLYYTSYAGSSADGIWKIRYTASGNTPPSVTELIANPASSSTAPLTTTLTATASDPDAGSALTYFWDFGDGTTATTASSSTSKTFNTIGNFTVSVRARDNNFAFSAPRTLVVQVGNTPPTVTMTSPAAGTLYAVGDTINLTATASDAQDGNLPPASLSWTVILHHDVHTHPFFGPQTGNSLQIVAPPPEDLSAATNSYLEVQLTATDSGGLTTTISRNINPRKLNLDLQSVPTGLRLDLNGTIVTTPSTVVVWENWQLPVSVRDQNRGSSGYRFSSWSDGGARSHSYDVPGVNSTLTANFATGAFVPFIDVDNNGQVQAATDGVLIIRYLLGFRDDNLIAGNVIGANAERTTAASIANYLSSVIASFDVDGRSGVTAHTDGLVILRHLLGVSDAQLLGGTGATITPGQARTNIQALTP